LSKYDIDAAYLNAEIKEELYMKAPEGYSSYNNTFWKLNKDIYGLKQAGRAWNEKLNNVLLGINFNRLTSEPCIYIRKNSYNEIICIIAVYVDDILLIGKENEVLQVKEQIKTNFSIKDIGELDFIIGIKFEKCNNGYIMHQLGYINELLKKFKLEKCKPIKNLMPIESHELKAIKFDETLYRSAIGNLLYLAICTRPDILFSVNRAAIKNKNPTLEDWINVEKSLKYLKGTKNYGIKISGESNLMAYADADYGGDTITRKSTSGFLIMLGNSPSSWVNI